MVEPTESALGHSPFRHRGDSRKAIATMTWTFDIMLEKKKESKKRVIFFPICCMNKLLCDTNENFHEIATKEICCNFMKKLLVSPKHYSEKSFKKIKRLKSLQKAEVYLEAMGASTMELFWEYINGFIFSQYKLHHRCSTGLYIGFWKYWDFQSETKLEQIIEIVTTHSVSC